MAEVYCIIDTRNSTDKNNWYYYIGSTICSAAYRYQRHLHNIEKNPYMKFYKEVNLHSNIDNLKLKILKETQDDVVREEETKTVKEYINKFGRDHIYNESEYAYSFQDSTIMNKVHLKGFKVKAKKYNGDLMGQCHTKEATSKMVNTQSKLYGNGLAFNQGFSVNKRVATMKKLYGKSLQINTKESHEKSFLTKSKIYNGDIAGQLHTKEVINRSLSTRTKIYGNPAGNMLTKEAITKNNLSKGCMYYKFNNSIFLGVPSLFKEVSKYSDITHGVVKKACLRGEMSKRTTENYSKLLKSISYLDKDTNSWIPIV